MANRRQWMIAVGAISGALAGGAIARTIWKARRRERPRFRMQSPWVNDAEFIGYFVGLEHGWYEEEGVDLEYLEGGPEVPADGKILSRKAEIALAPLETVAKLVREQAAPLVIIGTQYQKSPLGIVSLATAPIRRPSDLIGKRLAVPQSNLLSIDALFRLNQIDKAQVKIVPYQYDPTQLVNGQVDATVDFVTNVPYTIEQKGKRAVSFLLYDFGLKVFNDVVITTKEVLLQRRQEVKAWLRASRRGWQENFKDPERYPRTFMQTWYAKTGRTIENEIFFNKAQQPLIESQRGIFSMTQEAVVENLDTLKTIGIEVDWTLFDPTVLAEVT